MLQLASAHSVLRRLFELRVVLGAVLATAATGIASGQGLGLMMTTNGAGALTTQHAENGWRSTWHIAATGNFGGANGDDVLLYDRIRGDGRFMNVDQSGDFSSLSLQTHWSNTWDQVVTGNFDGSGQTDLLFYSATTGIARFYSTGANGSLTLLASHSGWNQWDTIVTGNFGGTSHTDLFLYSRTRGAGKFFTTDGAGNISLLASYVGLNKNWDQICSGRFNSNGYSGLFFYQRVLGWGKFYSTDGSGGLQLMGSNPFMRKSWDLVVPGKFGGSALRTDLLFYDRTAGEARIAFSDGFGGMQMKPIQNVSKTWSHVASVDAFASRSRVFAYDNTVQVRLRAVRCADDDGSRMTAITPAQVASWVDRANTVYARAGVRIEFDPVADFETVHSTMLNTLDTCSQFSTQAACDAHKAAATSWADQHPCQIVCYFRWGNRATPTGTGFSSETANYIAMTGFDATQTTRYYQDANHPLHGVTVQGLKLFAHELGHFLGLDHTHLNLSYPFGITPHNRVVQYLAGLSSPSMTSLDADRSEVWDTPPDLKKSYFEFYGWNPADLTREITINAPSLGLNFSFSPDRHNVMSYFGICDDYERVSPDQVRKIRHVLHTAKSDYIDSCANHIVGTKTSYGSGCPTTAGAVPSLTVIGLLEIGNAINFLVSNGAASSLALLAVGNDRSNTPLDSIGMPGCVLLVNNLPSVTFSLNSAGAGWYQVPLPNDPALIGAVVTSQSAVLDGTAPGTLPLVMTNAVELRLGGNL